MKAEMKIETTVVLKMTTSEAQWLQGLVQNPPSDLSEEDREMCKNLFYALNAATNHNHVNGNLKLKEIINDSNNIESRNVSRNCESNLPAVPWAQGVPGGCYQLQRSN